MSLLTDPNYWADQMAGRDDYKRFDAETQRLVANWENSPILQKDIERLINLVPEGAYERFADELRDEFDKIQEYFIKTVIHLQMLIDRHIDNLLRTMAMLESVVYSKKAQIEATKQRLISAKTFNGQKSCAYSLLLKWLSLGGSLNTRANRVIFLKDRLVKDSEIFYLKFVNKCEKTTGRVFKITGDMKKFLNDIYFENLSKQQKVLSWLYAEKEYYYGVDSVSRLRADVAEIVRLNIDKFDDLKELNNDIQRILSEYVESNKKMLVTQSELLDSLILRFEDYCQDLILSFDTRFRFGDFSTEILALATFCKDEVDRTMADVFDLMNDESRATELIDKIVSRQTMTMLRIEQRLQRFLMLAIRHINRLKKQYWFAESFIR